MATLIRHSTGLLAAHPGGSVRALAALVGTMLTIAACAPAEGEDSADAARTPGQALFDENCATCHGDRALGDGPLASTLPVEPPSLLEHLGHHPMDQLVRIIRTGVPPAMPPAPLTEDEVLQVIDYAWTLVPDSMVAGLREMQRMAEMGMDMSGMSMDEAPADGMPEDSIDHGAMGHSTSRDTTRR